MMDRAAIMRRALAEVMREKASSSVPEVWNEITVPVPEITIDNSQVAEAVQSMTGMIRAMREETIAYAANVRELARKPTTVLNDVKPADVYIPEIIVPAASVHVQAADLSGLADAIREQTERFTEFMGEIKKMLRPRKRKIIKGDDGEITGWQDE